jgi:hypothetical protein
MALDKVSLENSIKSLINTLKTYDGSTSGQTQEDAINKFASDLANAIDTFVKTGAVNTTVGFPIPVQVTPATGTGATTATGSGTGSIT